MTNKAETCPTCGHTLEDPPTDQEIVEGLTKGETLQETVARLARRSSGRPRFHEDAS